MLKNLILTVYICTCLILHVVTYEQVTLNTTDEPSAYEYVSYEYETHSPTKSIVTRKPTKKPTSKPTKRPTLRPTKPTIKPSKKPTLKPTRRCNRRRKCPIVVCTPPPSQHPTFDNTTYNTTSP